MKKTILLVFSIVMLSNLVTAMPKEKTTGFVCPVINSEAVGEHNPNAVPLGDTNTYTVAQPTSANGGNLMIPVHATNMDGSGIPGGPQTSPGDKGYTAIWAAQN